MKAFKYITIAMTIALNSAVAYAWHEQGCGSMQIAAGMAVYTIGAVVFYYYIKTTIKEMKGDKR